RDHFATARGTLHVAASGCVNRHGFAIAIVDGLKARGAVVKTKRIVPVRSTDLTTTGAIRPCNSRLDLTRLAEVFSIRPLHWIEALGRELDQIAGSPDSVS